MKAFFLMKSRLSISGLLILAALGLFSSVSASLPTLVEISEICPSNKAAYLTETGESPDWIELKRTGGNGESLEGWYLSNDEDDLRLVSLADYQFSENDCLILKADRTELPFKLSSSGGSLYLTDREGNTQSVSYPPLTSDQTYSLQPDGEWHVTEATPGAENAAGAPYVEPPFVAPPKFSHAAGFFDEPFDLSLSGYGDVKIYYTTDGSIPDENATLYTTPIHIENRSGEPNVWSAREDIQLTDLASAPPDFLVDKCSIIRAVAVDAAGNKSEAITNTYFVDLKYDNIDVLSIVATPHDLFDKDDGIYVRGKIYTDWLNDPNQDHAVPDYYIPTNFGKTNPLSSREREIPADFQLFDASGNLLLNQTLAIRIQGNYSRLRAQKSFKATARKEISGDGKIAIRLWDNLPKMKQILVRADGNTTEAPSVDVFAHMVVSEQGQITSRATPTIVFLDGEYWGLYSLRPSLDERYISAYTGIAEDDLIMVKNNQFKVGGENLPAYKSWNTLLRELGGKDFSKETEYQEITSLIDVDSYIRFTAANLYLQNRDMNDTQNVTTWRTIEQNGEGLNDGRWRWMYQNMDLTCELGYEKKVFQEILPNLSMLKMLWKNPDFQRQFLDTLEDFMNVDCSEGRIEKLLQQYSEMYGPYIYDTQLRYSSQSRRSTQQMAANIRQFFNSSRQSFLTQFADAMEIETPICTLIADCSTADGVDLSINNRRALYLNRHWTGCYFAGSSLTLSVSDVPTYEFLGWYEGGTLLTQGHELTLTITENRAVAPRFQAIPRILEMNEQKSVFPRWGKTNLVSNDFNITASIDADDGLILEADTRAVLTAEDKWIADMGLTISCNTIQYNAMQLFMDARVEGNAPSKWELLWSLDGNTWETIAGFKLGEEKTSLQFSLPEEMNDMSQAYLRLASEKKGKSGALTLENLAVCGQKQRFSLATIRYYTACLSNLLGDSYAPPDTDALMQLTAVEISEMEKELKSQLIDELIGHNRSVVRQALADVPQFQMFADCPVFHITEEICGLSREEWVNAGGLPDGEAYLYRWEDGRLLHEATCTIEAGYFLMPLAPGVFVLTDSRFESKAYSVDILRSALSQELVDKALGGLYPAPSYHLNVTLYAAGVDTIHLDALSGQAILPELWVYKIMPDHSLVFVGTVLRNDNGSYDLPCAETGEYLLLTESLEDHLDEAETHLRRLNPES